MKQFQISGRDGVFWRCGQGFPPHPDFAEVGENTFDDEQWEILKAEPNLIIKEVDGDGAGTGDNDKPVFPWKEGLGSDRTDLTKKKTAELNAIMDGLFTDAMEVGLEKEQADTIQPTTNKERVSAIVWLEQFIAEKSKDGKGRE